ncbi:MAG: glycosyltransferase family 39 protein [Planctomycetaceae bacterium]
MNALNTFLQSPLPRFADSLAACQPKPLERSRSRSVIAALVFLCLVPRAVLAWMLEVVCSDGYYYIAVADALDRGDLPAAFSYLNLNVYPAVLLLLHRAGLEWVFAAKLWGVLIGSLTVLPLFGWVRRMFDDRIAVIACLLYAVHPEVIELSPEPIRETTFWFLATLFLYAAIRAVAENKLWLFALAGVTLTLAVHTRSEGWLLVLPVVAWSAFRFRRQTRARLKLIGGIAVCLAVLPGLLFMTNVTLLRHHPQWEWGRLEFFRTAYYWAVPVSESPQPPAVAEPEVALEQSPAAAVASPNVQSVRNHSVGAALPTYLDAFISSFEPLAVFLTLVGLVVARGALLQRDKLLLWILAPGILAAVWIRLLVIGNLNGRYFLTLFFLLAPFTAIGQLMLLRWLNAVASRLGGVAAAKRLSPAVILFLIVCGCWVDALTFDHAHRANEAALGRWLRSQIGPVHLAVVDKESATVGYFAQAGFPRMLLAREGAEDVLPTSKPDLLIIEAGDFTSWSSEYREVVATSCASQGLERMTIDESLRAGDHYVVFGTPMRQSHDVMEGSPTPPIPSRMRSAARE